MQKPFSSHKELNASFDDSKVPLSFSSNFFFRVSDGACSLYATYDVRTSCTTFGGVADGEDVEVCLPSVGSATCDDFAGENCVVAVSVAAVATTVVMVFSKAALES